ncbi:hypothetical protein Enr13x_06550 [Stieleria neptunia]|uniref:Uncharacterized protein n=1 Tax=Stieleria neptunia TaxID=2527979 RepID=A0A518HJ31_9BACT|nr:hypothetical protein Enr13x_06550 [Stieleria neptunia]
MPRMIIADHGPLNALSPNRHADKELVFLNKRFHRGDHLLERLYGFRTTLVLRQLLFIGYRGKGVRYQKCETPCGPFGFWYLTPFPLDKRRLEN